MRTPTVGFEDPDAVYANRWWTLGTLCVALMVIGVDNTILNVALPSIVRELGASGSELQLMVDAYVIIFAGLLLTAGSLGDRYGRKYALLFGLAWFGACSGLASLATNPTMLILARGLMGLGGAFIFPTTLSILTNTFREPSERARAIGIWAGVSGVGIALGPLLGGFLVEQFGWPSVFLVNLPICSMAFYLSWRFVPNTRDPEESPLDPFGAIFSILGLSFFLYGIIEAPDVGWTAPRVAVGFVVGIVFLTLFAWWEWRNPEPMLDVRFFKNARFSAASATITLTFFGFFATTFLLTQYFQFILDYSPFKAGLMIVPTAVGMMTASPLAPRMVERWGTKKVVVLGLGLIAFGTACYASNTIMSNLPGGLFVRLVMGVGFGISSAPVTESIMGSLPPSRAGVGSAVNDTTRQTGGALGVAVIGSVLASIYGSQVGDFLNGKPVPSGTATQLKQSLGLALAAGKQVPGLSTTAIDGFIDGMHAGVLVAAGVALLGAVIAFVWLPARASYDALGEAVPEAAASSIDATDAAVVTST
jgi:EmrB/QacA subfamily drug resistance transporter